MCLAKRQWTRIRNKIIEEVSVESKKLFSMEIKTRSISRLRFVQLKAQIKKLKRCYSLGLKIKVLRRSVDIKFIYVMKNTAHNSAIDRSPY